MTKICKTIIWPLLLWSAVGIVSASPGTDPARARVLSCDDSIMTGFAPDANTRVVLVKSFHRGEPLRLGSSAPEDTPSAANDICLVKLVVGPGNPGPMGAPSTAEGIGIEVWLPTPHNWNGRIHALGGGGWQGGLHTSPAVIASPDAAAIAAEEGAVSSQTDTGHTDIDGPIPGNARGSFAMNPDGTINQVLWKDFASRAIYEQAVKTKALATAYYGASPRHIYWEGGSTGGRQGLKLAQEFPDLYDGIIADCPAINWTRFITAELYPQVVFQRDLGGVALSREQEDLVSKAAIAACDVVGGEHLGYLLDPQACTYDPTKDRNVLCATDGGTNTTAACVTHGQAVALNKIWYGMTADGSAPDPAIDNGWAAAEKAILPTGSYRWFGLSRGTSLYGRLFLPKNLMGLADPSVPFSIAADQVALSLQNSTVAGPTFANASGNGQSLWKLLSYAQLSNAFDRGIALQSLFGHINTDSPDLSKFKKRGGKLLTWHGYADELIMPQGTVNYYNRVAAQLGSLADVQSFYRLYMLPGIGHGTPNGTANPDASPPNFAPHQFYQLLTDWVEKGKAPEQVTLRSGTAAAARSMPACVYPKKVRYHAGNPQVASSYTCS